MVNWTCAVLVSVLLNSIVWSVNGTSSVLDTILFVLISISVVSPGLSCVVSCNRVVVTDSDGETLVVLEAAIVVGV